MLSRYFTGIILFGIGCSIGGLCVIGAAGAKAAQDASDRPINVSPNILASRDGNFYHAELMIAANPKNPSNLIGGAITPTSSDGGPATRTYTTYDGGYAWTESIFPDLVKSGGGDPQVAFSPHGTAYFASLAMVKDDLGRTRSALHFYRSEDGGTKWSGPIDLGYSYDHPQIVVDQTYGQYAGRIYIGVLYGRDYSLGVFRSDDEGRTFTGPVKVLDGAGIGVNVTSLMVLSNGELVMTYADFQIDPARRKSDRESNLWLVTSKDGGITFSRPVKVLTQKRALLEDDPLLRLSSFPAYAIDSQSKGYKDRLYAVVSDFSKGKPAISLTFSTDGGNTWRQPEPVDPNSPPDSIQYQPAIAVNNTGVVGVMWFDARGLKDASQYYAYFTASTDGGKSFLPPARLSSEPSDRFGPGNLAFSPFQGTFTPDDVRLAVLSAATRWSNGGDYMGLVADSAGVFHPFWTDSRTGTFQAMSSEVRVVSPVAAISTAPSGKTSPAAEKVEASVTARVDMIFDPTIYDAAAKELLIPVRLKNNSTEPIYPPIRVKITSFGSGMGDMFKDKAPVILNASNGKRQEGAEFDYSPALRDMISLQPGAQTEAMIWKLKLNDPFLTPDIHIQVTGSVERKTN